MLCTRKQSKGNRLRRGKKIECYTTIVSGSIIITLSTIMVFIKISNDVIMDTITILDMALATFVIVDITNIVIIIIPITILT